MLCCCCWQPYHCALAVSIIDTTIVGILAYRTADLLYRSGNAKIDEYDCISISDECEIVKVDELNLIQLLAAYWRIDLHETSVYLINYESIKESIVEA
ncbi:unnamed protein product [Acanthocheilonema viteae]|uniref:Uncharacterized protein n=1 Tax=Acanthocheilonema viteae TaxID=6277 RepID=A0A498STU0_ACAVI|nr:unnamed protein product [Acanthocheilonema viteae]